MRPQALQRAFLALVENTEEKLKLYRDNHQIWKAMFLDPRVMKAGFQNEPDKLKKHMI